MTEKFVYSVNKNSNHALVGTITNMGKYVNNDDNNIVFIDSNNHINLCSLENDNQIGCISCEEAEKISQRLIKNEITRMQAIIKQLKQNLI